MEVIKDFFAGLKDRISSPFFISFLISWSVCNYRITVPLLFYKHEDVKWDYKSSYLDLIQQLHDRELIYLWTPLLFSLIFSGVYPVLKSGFEFFQEYIITHKDKFYYKHLAKVEAISVEKHRELSDKLKLDQAKYADEIRTRDARIADKERLEAEGQTLKERIAQMEDSQKLFSDQLDAEHTSYIKAQERSEHLFADLELANSKTLALSKENADLRLDLTNIQADLNKTEWIMDDLLAQIRTLKEETQRFFRASGVLPGNDLLDVNSIDEQELRKELTTYFDRLKDIEDRSSQ